MPKQIKVVIADDHPIFRHGLRQLIHRDGIVVLGEASEGAKAMELIRTHKPDVAVLDIDMPIMNGLEVARKINSEQIPTKLVFLTGSKEESTFNNALDLGALGYVLKDSAIAEIVIAITTVMQDKPFISPEISRFLLNRFEGSQSLRKQRPGLERLTPSEKRILRLIADNRTSKEIADELGLSTRTVENHRANICNKLDLHGIHSLVKFAFENKSKLAV